MGEGQHYIMVNHLVLILLVAIVSSVGSSSAIHDQTLLSLPPHPRIRLTNDRLEAIRSLVKTEAPAAQVMERALQHGEELLRAPLVNCHKSGVEDSLLSQARSTLDRTYTLGFLYRYTGNTSYAKRAIVDMLNVCVNCTTWNPDHFLDVGEFTHALGIGYDWLYPELSDDDKATIINATSVFGFQAGLEGYKTHAWWATTPVNWNLVCNGGLAIGALAFMDDVPELAVAVFGNASVGLPKCVSTYGPSGGWPEGETYWGYATKYYLAVVESMKTALGTDHGLSEFPGVNDTGLFRLYGTGPSLHLFNWGDSDVDSEDEFEPNLMLLAKQGGPYASAYAAAARDLFKLKNTHTGSENAVLNLIGYTPIGSDDDIRNLPTARAFPFDTDGWDNRLAVGILRSQWLNSSATWLGFRGGNGQSNHNDLDAGHFNFDMIGENWAIDLGSDSYGLPHYFSKTNTGRYKYYRKATVGHNTMVFNCDNGTPERCNQDDQSISTIVHFDPTGVSLVDMSDAYNKHGISKYQRGFSLAEHDSVVVVQDVFAGASNFTWTMHTLANITVQGTKAKLQAGNKVIYAVLESPSNSLQFSTAEATDSPPQRPLVGIQKLMVAGTSDGATERLTVCFGLSIEACPAPQ